MARKLIDISVPLQNDVPADPPGGHPTNQYIEHQQGLPRMLGFFEGSKAEDLPDRQGWAFATWPLEFPRPGPPIPTTKTTLSCAHPQSRGGETSPVDRERQNVGATQQSHATIRVIRP